MMRKDTGATTHPGTGSQPAINLLEKFGGSDWVHATAEVNRCE